MPRRRKIGEAPIYDDFFDNLKEQSSFLNPKGQVVNNLLVEASNDPAAVLAEWLEKIPKAQAALDAAILEFDKLQNKARRTGRPVPETEPPAIVEMRLRAEAKIDVTNDEIVALKRMVEARKKADAKRNAAAVLPHGPKGVGYGEPLREIDGQKVIEKDGQLVISCKESQYDGLRLDIYHSAVVLPYLRACRKAKKETGRAVAPWPPMPEA